MNDFAMGWLPDHPDHRDFTPSSKDAPAPAGQTRNVYELLSELHVTEPAPTDQLPGTVDLRPGFSAVEDQGALGSCTANAAAGLLEYFQRSASGASTDASRLFIYKATRDLMHESGDTGAFLRTTMQTLASFGAPPESYWPYDVSKFDEEPAAFCYAFAADFKALQYYRLDPPGTSPQELLQRIKTNLNAKLPSMFGFTVFSSYRQADHDGEIPFPSTNDRRVGGHAIVACGYDDAKEITNEAPNSPPTTGAILIRNSWGHGWGDHGCGWLPYEYVVRSLATDWWSLVKADWVDAGAFG
jgi:C1A family cysteine protease